MSEQKLRVYWIPQVGRVSEAFYVPVRDLREAKLIIDALAVYDAYQLQENIKPDYCSVGGLEMYDEEEGEWIGWYLETDDEYYDDFDEYCDKYFDSDDDAKLRSELYEQVNWDRFC